MANPPHRVKIEGEAEVTCSQAKTRTNNTTSAELLSGEHLPGEAEVACSQQQPTLQNGFCGGGNNGRDAQSQIPARPDILPGDDLCQNAFRHFLQEPSNPNKIEAMKYLSRIGWKLDENLGYTSPWNVKFDSVQEACEYLTKVPSSSHSKSQVKVLHEKKIKPCPQAVVDWYLLASADKRKTPRKLSSEVKEYMFSTGWRSKSIKKNTKNGKAKHEWRYISPEGRIYISLVRACKQIMEDTAGSTSHQPSAGSHGMQSQVHNQGQSQISGVQSSTSLPPALPFVTSLTQTSMPISAGQKISMQSGIAQNFVGRSVSQGVPSIIVSNSLQQLHQMPSCSKANIEHNVVDWQEEIYQKIQSMKETYFTDLYDMYHVVSIKCKKDDKLKSLKIKLKNIIDFFYVSKKEIIAGMIEKYLADLNEVYHKICIVQHSIPESEKIEELKSWKTLLKRMIHPFYVDSE